MTIAPPGCECQPEEAPAAISFLTVTTSAPGLTRRLPSANLPCPRRVETNPLDGGVAAPGTALNIRNTPADNAAMSPSRMPRLVRVPTGCLLGPRSPRRSAGLPRQGELHHFSAPTPACLPPRRVRRDTTP